MVFASPIFLFLFLPVTLAAYFAVPRTWRNGVLLVASLAFYAWGEAPYLALVIASVLFNFAIGGAIGRAQDPRVRRRWLAAGVAGCWGEILKASGGATITSGADVRVLNTAAGGGLGCRLFTDALESGGTLACSVRIP